MKTATIVPVHPKHLNEGVECYKSFKEHSKNDFYFVFSSNEDRDLFASKIDLPNYVMIDESLMNRYPGNPITVKKVFALHNLFDKYDYMGVFDAETRFVRPFDSDVIYPDVFGTKEFKCNTTRNGGGLVRKTAIGMGLENNQILLEQTKNFSQYWWFNEVCVYEKNTFFEFFEFFNQPEVKDIVLTHRDYFDYIMYGIWLICFRGFKTRCFFDGVEFYWGAIELNNKDFVSQTFNSYIDRNPNYAAHEKVKALIQLDLNV